MREVATCWSEPSFQEHSADANFVDSWLFSMVQVTKGLPGKLPHLCDCLHQICQCTVIALCRHIHSTRIVDQGLQTLGHIWSLTNYGAVDDFLCFTMQDWRDCWACIHDSMEWHMDPTACSNTWPRAKLLLAGLQAVRCLVEGIVWWDGMLKFIKDSIFQVKDVLVFFLTLQEQGLGNEHLQSALDTLLPLVGRMPGDESEEWLAGLGMAPSVQEAIEKITSRGGGYSPDYTQTSTYQTREEAENMLMALGFGIGRPSPWPGL